MVPQSNVNRARDLESNVESHEPTEMSLVLKVSRQALVSL
jgi:hypothetical protein